jgi:hypothetical protein
MDPWLWAYSDRLSARPGERVALHVAGTAPRCEVEIARVGRERRVVARQGGVAIAAHPTPARAHVVGCRWPAAVTIEVGDWPSGYYDVRLRGTDGAEARHLLVVKAARPTAPAVLVLATNTYHAYNWWGGANTYLWLGGPAPAPIPDDPGERVVAGRLSAERPFSAGLLQPRCAAHRIVTRARRGFREPPSLGEVVDEAEAGGQPWDCPAGYLDKWEHAFVAWAEAAGYALDFVTDYDLESDPDALAGRRLALCVGHSEYWSWEGRAALERFVDGGGRLAILSGNTCYWQCRWEDGGRIFVAHKARADQEDPVARDPRRRHLTTGHWSSPTVGRPEAALTGLSFLFGGYHRFGLCVARGAGGYTVWRDEHWALAGTDLFWGDVFGDDCRLVGYENDGAPFTIGPDGLPRAVPRLGVPEALEILATAPATIAEPAAAEYPHLVPPEVMDVLARDYAAGAGPERLDDEGVAARLLRGHAVMATFRRGAGEVFHAGTTEWAYGLAAGNPFVDRITRNVLDRFLAG